MAQVFVDEARHAAGAAYFSALERVGLEPDGLFWAWDKIDDRFVLVLVSRFFDIAGPLKLSQLLFRAYRAEITPAAIDPLALRLHSPAQSWLRDLATRQTQIQGASDTGLIYSDDVLDVPLQPIYRLSIEPDDAPDLLKYWRLIERNVEQLAA